MNIKIKQFTRNPVIGGLLAVAIALLIYTVALPSYVSAQNGGQGQGGQGRQGQAQQEEAPKSYFGGEIKDGPECGKGDNVVKTRVNFGCLGSSAPRNLSPIEDMLYAFIRFLSIGVGIVIIGSIILAGIQYSTSEGNPETTQAAKNRIRNAIIGLFIYIFAFAIVQYLVPGGALY